MIAFLHPLDYCMISIPTAPAGYPQNVMTTTLSPTEIRVNWEPMPAIEENGIITTYEILYEPQETFGGEIMSDTINTTDGSVLEMVLNDLQEFVEYNITVRTYTSVGSGPFNPIGDTSRTLEDGKSIILTLFVEVVMVLLPCLLFYVHSTFG